MFRIWSREFNSHLAVHGNKFVITLPLNDILHINSIKQTNIGNWIELHGTIEEPKVSSINIIDGNRTENEGSISSRHASISCRASQGKEEKGTEAQAKARAEQLF
jgi:hypothetical protein